MTEDAASCGFRGHASNLRKTMELVDIHNGQMFDFEHEYSSMNERLGKSETKTYILALGESSVPATSYSGANYTLTGSEKMWSTTATFGTWRDTPLVMEGMYDGRFSRMTIFTPQITCVPPANNLNAQFADGLLDSDVCLQFCVNLATTEILVSSAQWKRSKYVNAHVWIERDNPIDLDKYIYGWKLCEPEMALECLPNDYINRPREHLWNINDLLVGTKQDEGNDKNEKDSPVKPDGQTDIDHQHTMELGSLLTPMKVRTIRKKLTPIPLAVIEENENNTNEENVNNNNEENVNNNNDSSKESLSNEMKKDVTEISEVKNDDKKVESPCDILAKKYYTDLRDFVRLNHELYRKAKLQQTYKFSKMYHAKGMKDITCTPLEIRANRLTFTFARDGMFGDICDSEFDETNMDSLIKFKPEWEQVTDETGKIVAVLIAPKELTPIAVNCVMKYLEEGTIPLYVPDFMPLSALTQALQINPQLFARYVLFLNNGL